MRSFESKSLDWLTEALEAVNPIGLDQLEELKNKKLQIGVEAEASRRLSAVLRELQSERMVEEDPDILALKKRVVEDFRLLERRLQLGEAGRGIRKFCLHRGGEITAGK